jgi:hypothetical protein
MVMRIIGVETLGIGDTGYAICFNSAQRWRLFYSIRTEYSVLDSKVRRYGVSAL